MPGATPPTRSAPASARPGISRRSALQAGLAGLAVFGVGAGGLAVWPTTEADAPADLLVLSPRTWSVLSALAEAVCPSGGGWPTAAAIGVASKIDKLMAGMDKDDADQLVLALLLIDNALAGLALDRRIGTFSGADLADRRRALQAWRESALPVRRTAFKALRGLCASAYFADPRTEAMVGYPGAPNFGQADAPAIQAPQSAEAPQSPDSPQSPEAPTAPADPPEVQP
jgi:hypothetical protein